MNIKLICSSLLAMSIASTGFSGDDDEHMEVTAPNECCLAALPGGLGLLTGWVGAAGTSGAASGGGSLKDVALKAAVGKAIKQKGKAKEKKEVEKTEYDKATDGVSDTSTLYRELGLTVRQLFENGGKERFKYSKTNPDGTVETMEYEDCIPSGPLNPKKITCTEQKFELFTDPTDGAERWAFTLSIIEAAHNPKHYYANEHGWYPEVVDNQTFTLVFESESDLLYQLNKVAGR